MKYQNLIGKYLHFSLLTAILLFFFAPILAFPNQRVHLRARRNPSQEGVVSPWRRQASGDKLVSELLDAIKEALNATDDPNSCTNCSDIKKENSKLKEEVAKNDHPLAKKLKPAYDCDKWENKSRSCWLDRNVGDTVTFVLAFAEGASPKVQWRQEFHVLKSKKTRKFDIDPDNPMWNVVIGSRGHELRLSPVTEMDVDSNFFSASVVTKKGEMGEKLATQTVNFRIRVMPVDQGFVYPGETLRLTMKSADLPPTSMSFQWYLEKEGEERSLPSNMKVSPSGSVLTVTELRMEQEGVLACSVYTNLDVLATRKRFLIKEINQSNNQLLFEPTRPGKTQHRRKRDLSSADNLKWAFRLPEEHNIDSRNAQLQTARYAEYDAEADGSPEAKTERRRIQDRQVNDHEDDSLEAKTERQRIQDRQVNDHEDDSLEAKAEIRRFKERQVNDQDMGSLEAKTERRRIQDRQANDQEDGSLETETERQSIQDGQVNDQDIGSLEAQTERRRIQERQVNDQDDDSLEFQTERRRLQDRQVTDQDTAGKEGGQGDMNGSDPSMNQQSRQSNNQFVLEIERQPDRDHVNAQEEYSKLISNCISDLQCSSNAGCVQREPDRPGFCRCNSGFQGSGIFCWEENQPKKSAVFSDAGG